DLSLKSPTKSGTFSRDLGDRPWRIVAAGSAISANVYHCAAIAIDPDTAKRSAAANNPERIRQETDWSPRRARSPVDGTARSRWQPSRHPQWPSSDDDLSIPKFLRRAPEIA